MTLKNKLYKFWSCFEVDFNSSVIAINERVFFVIVRLIDVFKTLGY